MRDYAPLPLEYLAEMAPLSDADFGRLVRALLLYAKDGTPVALEGDCRFYCARVMNKDDYYAEKFAEEEEKRERISRRNSRNAKARYESGCDGMPPQAMAGNNNTNQINSSHDKPNHSISCHNSSTSAKADEAASALVMIPLNDRSEYPVFEEDVREWQKTFPAVDVEQQLKEMRAWCLANPKLCKTRAGVKRFIVTWLSKQQDRGHPGQAVKAQPERAFVPSEL